MGKTEQHIEILLVDDSIEDAKLTIRSLKEHNLANDILHLEDGEEALDYLTNKGGVIDKSQIGYPGLILLDLNLPKVSGLEILKKIKTNKETKDIPVVVLTSSSEDVDIKKSYEYGVNSYIVKPVEFNEFIKAVKDLGVYWLDMNKSLTK